MGTHLLGRIPRGDGGSVCVTYHYDNVPSATLTAPKEMYDQNKKELDDGHMTAMLFLGLADSSWFTVEGPIRPSGTDAVYALDVDSGWKP